MVTSEDSWELVHWGELCNFSFLANSRITRDHQPLFSRDVAVLERDCRIGKGYTPGETGLQLLECIVPVDTAP